MSASSTPDDAGSETAVTTESGASGEPAETLDSLFRNVSQGDTLRQKDGDTEVTVVNQQDGCAMAGTQEEGLIVEKPDGEEAYLPRSKADQWKVVRDEE